MKAQLTALTWLTINLISVGAKAQAGPQGTKYSANQLIGIDYLDGAIRFAIEDLVSSGKIANGTISYLPLFNVHSQGQLEGGLSSAGEPTCEPNNSSSTPDANRGCQEIAPMSRMLNSDICNDAESQGAEMLAICRDYIVLIMPNLNAQAYPPPGSTLCTTATSTPGIQGIAAKLGGTNKVLSTGYSIGANGVEPWRDVLRLVYTGCKNSDNPTGYCNVTANRVARCSDPSRAALVSTWDALFDGGACTGGGCSGGLKRAYRRDDYSVEATTFLRFIGVKGNLQSRATTCQGIINPTTAPASNDHAYCDGGDLEGFTPNAAGLLGDAAYGDPIRPDCTDDEDICGGDGKMNLVRAVRSVTVNLVSQTSTKTAPIAQSVAFPTRMCTPGVFRKGQGANSACKYCPDGNAVSAASPISNCLFPVDVNAPFSTTNPNFNCWNRKKSVPQGKSTNKAAANYLDGRSYNVYTHGTNSTKLDFAAANVADIAAWRDQSIDSFPGGLTVTNPTLTMQCTERDAANNIGCIVSNANCSIGFSTKTAAMLEPYASGNEALQIDAADFGDAGPSPLDLERPLFIASIGGFENTVADCEARDGASSPFCNAQKELVNYFHDLSVGSDGKTNGQRACAASGYDSPPAPVCVSGMAPGGPGCGSSDGNCVAN